MMPRNMTGVHLAGESESEAGSGQKVTAALIISKWAKEGLVNRGCTVGPGHVSEVPCCFCFEAGGAKDSHHTRPMDPVSQ